MKDYWWIRLAMVLVFVGGVILAGMIASEIIMVILKGLGD